MENFTSLPKAAKMISISDNTLFNWVKSGKVEVTITATRRVFFSPEQLDKLIKDYAPKSNV